MPLELEQWEAIDRMLGDEGVGARLEESVPGWRFGLDQAQTEWARLLLDDEWAGFEAALPDARRGASDWELLELNAVLPGACKIGLRLTDQRRVLLDVPLDDGAAAAARCRLGLADLIACWSWLARAGATGPMAGSRLPDSPAAGSPAGDSAAEGSRATDSPATPPGSSVAAAPATPPGEGVPVDWIRAAGWTCQARPDGRVVVQPKARRQAQPIWVARETSGVLRLWTPIGGRQQLADTSLLGLGRYLLRVTGQRRLVRAAADLRDTSSPEVRFEVRLPEPLDAGLVDHGLSSLALAVVTAGREARALADGELAGHYAGMWCS